MIKDDYFFIVHRVLNCLYIDFKEGNGVKFTENMPPALKQKSRTGWFRSAFISP